MASNKDAELETPLLMPEEEEGGPTAPLLEQGSPEPTPRPRLPPPKFGELITVLSIDGGGIHGLIPTVVLKCLEEKLQAIDGEDARIADYFDVIAGMSAGAIIVTMLAAPNTNNRTKYTPQEIQDFYVKNGPNMFPSKRWWRWPLDLLSASWGPKYDVTFLQKNKTKEVTGEHTLSKLAAPTFDANILEPLIFSSFQDAVQNLVEEAGPDLPDVCIGPPSTATPTYFPAHYFDIWVSDMEQSKYHLIDGGNNPTMAAISKITREQLLMNPAFHPSGVDYMKYLVISVGAGCAVHENVPAKRGAFNWFHSRRNSHSPVTDTSSHASAVLADWRVRMLLHNGNCVRKQNYLYIQALAPLLGEAILPMDNATSKNMADLLDIGYKLLAEKVAMVDLTTGKYETVEDENAPTNDAELQRFSELLVVERHLRLKEQQRQRQEEEQNGVHLLNIIE
ncbi:hypothetical protein CFC21_090722 [Triticum aestivum]|uniref:Patatin n=2 Tax=Triticum aestivum TaxID=4565 RepID=A0A3B6Q8I5_WHEAT|nr:hypothetical protein CFC21_090722 [Triticum aestivum]